MGVKLISMHFRHHDLETEIDVISKLNFRIRSNGWFLAGLYVKSRHSEKSKKYLTFKIRHKMVHSHHFQVHYIKMAGKLADLNLMSCKDPFQ